MNNFKGILAYKNSSQIFNDKNEIFTWGEAYDWKGQTTEIISEPKIVLKKNNFRIEKILRGDTFFIIINDKQ